VESPDFIVPPPGLIPAAPRPSDESDRAEREAPRTLPAFPPPPGKAPPPVLPVPSTPPAAAEASAPVERIEAPTAGPRPGAWRLRAPGGLDVLLLRPVLLGRDPAADPGRPEAATIPLADPARSVSKTHALVEVVEGRVIVTDLHSTNGTRVLTSDGETRELDPGRGAEAPNGATLLLGEFAVGLDRAPLNSV
jgi:hypothetical protein